MNLKRLWSFSLAAAAVLLAAAATPALSQYKPGHGINVTVYDSPT